MKIKKFSGREGGGGGAPGAPPKSANAFLKKLNSHGGGGMDASRQFEIMIVFCEDF